MSDADTKLGFNATWSMAVGGMVGGGIFSTLGVVISIAGRWAWLSFLVAGVVALLAGYSYVKLADHYEEAGGAFTFLRRAELPRFAGSLSWVLIVGYVLTDAVYASTFGAYLSDVAGLGSWFRPAAAVAILLLFVALNLRGVGEAGGVEVFLVWFKLSVLLALAGFGLARWHPERLVPTGSAPGLNGALLGAASVFMAYEGFQLLTYDYDDIDRPRTTLPRAVLSAVAVVIGVYVVVALGTAMLVGADTVVRHGEVSLALAGRAAMGTAGLVTVVVAAAFSTGSAINSTLFATARLAHVVAADDELPAFFYHTNGAGVPDRAVVTLGGAAAALAVLGSLSVLVEAASLAFLFTFTVVCGLAAWKGAGRRALTGAGALAATAATAGLAFRLAHTDPQALAILLALVFVAVFGRPLLLRHTKRAGTEEP